MVNKKILKSLDIEYWTVRNPKVFSGYFSSTEMKVQWISDSSAKFDWLIILENSEDYSKLCFSFFQAMFGYQYAYAFVNKTDQNNGIALNELISLNKEINIISFMEIHQNTLNSENNVLILNCIDFKKLEKNISYKKQVMLDVFYRMSISSIRNK